MMRPGHVITTILLLLSMISCEEPFPPYSEPEGVLVGELSAVTPDTVDVYFDDRSGLYYVTSQLVFNVTMTNAYNDLLQGEALIDGEVSAQSFSAIPRVVLVPLTPSTLLQPPVFQGGLSLPPGGVASFSTLWIPYGTDGQIVFAGLPFTTVGTAKLYGPIPFSATARVQIFERVQPVEFGGIEFSIVFRELEVD
jgi:hypothetical protein